VPLELSGVEPLATTLKLAGAPIATAVPTGCEMIAGALAAAVWLAGLEPPQAARLATSRSGSVGQATACTRSMERREDNFKNDMGLD